jgi:hypothetical protein
MSPLDKTTREIPAVSSPDMGSVEDERDLDDIFDPDEDDPDEDDPDGGADVAIGADAWRNVEATLGSGDKVSLVCGRAYTLNEIVRMARG